MCNPHVDTTSQAKHSPYPRLAGLVLGQSPGLADPAMDQRAVPGRSKPACDEQDAPACAEEEAGHACGRPSGGHLWPKVVSFDVPPMAKQGILVLLLVQLCISRDQFLSPRMVNTGASLKKSFL